MFDAPPRKLRKWFGHDVNHWEDFRQRYRAELDANPGAWKPLLAASGAGTLTLLYSAHDTVHNGAVVLREYLSEKSGAHPSRMKRTRTSVRSRR